MSVQKQHHPSHAQNLPRLNRIAGQVEGIKKMIQDERYCPEILTQLLAVRAAVRNLEIEILDTHLSHCVAGAFQQADPTLRQEKVTEIRKLIRSFS